MKDNLHKDHRARVKERFFRNGLDDFAPHELLELILFYAVPQKDTNELAHLLLGRFGTVGNVLRASREELCTVPGVGEHVATLLHLWLPATAYALADDEKRKHETYEKLTSIGQYFVNRYIGATTETVYLMLLDNRYAMLDCIKVHEGSVNSVSITPRRLIELAIRGRASMAVLAHNHPSGIAVPSGEDINTTLSLKDAFSAVGITFLEHVLVAGDRYAPVLIRAESLLSSRVERRAFYEGYLPYGREG